MKPDALEHDHPQLCQPTTLSTGWGAAGKSRLRKILGALLLCLAGVTLTAIAADYMTPTLGTDLDEPADLVVENPQVLSETPIAGGRVLLEVGAQIRNVAETTWYAARVAARDKAINITVEAVGYAIQFSELSLPSQIISASSNLFTLVDAADLTTARSELLSGSVLYAAGEVPGTGIRVVTNALSVTTPRIVSETSLANGQVLVEVAADVRNSGSIEYSNVAVYLDSALGTVPYTPPLNSSTNPDLLGPSGVTTNLPPLYFVVRSNDLELARSNVLSGAALTHSGRELWVFSAPPKAIDEETHDSWRWPRELVGSDTRLVFTNNTSLLQSLHAGDLLVEDPSVFRLPTHYVGVNAPPPDQTLASVMPFLVSSVTVVSNEVHVVGRKQLLKDVIRSATFVADALDAYDRPVRDPYDPTLENTYTHEEETNRADVAEEIIAQYGPRDGRLADLKGFTATPWHFNITNLSDHIKISGELLFRQSGLKLEIKIREFQLQRAVARIDAGAILNVVVEADRGEDTTPLPTEKKTKELIPEDALPAVSFSLGGVPVVVQPVVSLKAGVEANIPTRLAVPLQSSFLVGMEMGFDRSRITSTNDGFYYQPFTQVVPLRLSDPSVFDDLAATLEAWAELGVGLKIGVGDEAASLRAGPTLAARLSDKFTLAPLANPWWSMDSGLDLIGRFTMDLSLMGFDAAELVDTEASLHHFDIFHVDAGGPLIQGNRSKRNVRPVSGKETRWGRLLVGDHWTRFNNGFVVKLTNSTDVVVGGASMLTRLNSLGSVVWGRKLALGGAADCGVALADGSFTVGGSYFGDIWVGNFSGEGERNWAVTLKTVDGFILRDLALGHNAAGAPEYYLVGHVQRAIVTRSDPQVIKLDASGQVLWSRSYDLPGTDDEAHGGTVTADGNLVIGGWTGYAVPPPAIGDPDPANILKSSGGLLMKVSGTDGSLLWANAFPAHWGLDFYRVIEAPDGTLFAAGGASRIVTQTRPSILFAKFKPDGTLDAHVTVGEDLDWPDELLTAGSTPYDNVTGLIWTPEGLWACGSTGLGDGTAGFVIGLTEEMGVRFYSVFDGPKSEEMLGLVDAGNGLAVLGNTYSSYPWGTGGLPVPFLLKLPWEGIMRFHPDSRLSSLFLQPRVYKSSADPDYIIFSRLTIPGAGFQIFAATSGAVPFAVTNAPLTVGGALPLPTDITNFATYSLEAVDPASVIDYSSWTDYHQLTGNQSDPAADPDDDGLPNYLEAYFNQNPQVPELAAPFTLSAGVTNSQETATLQFDRPVFASGFNVWFESSTNFQSWTTLTNLTQGVQTLDGLLEHVLLTAPRTQSQEFFRAAGRVPLPQ